MKTRDIVVTALLAAVVCVLSPLALPVGPVPITLSSFAVLLVSAVGGRKRGFAAVAVYILLGAFGAPVFAGFTGGFARIAGVTGGFILGYLPCAFAVGAVVDARENSRWAYFAAMLLGELILHAAGLAWYTAATKAGFAAAFAVCTLPFIAGDIVKLVAAATVSPLIRGKIKALK